MKRTLLTVLQLSITVLLLWWIFRDPGKRAQMMEAMQKANYLWLVPGIFSVGIAFVLQTQRWRMLLAAVGIDMGWWRTLRVFFIGAFFNLFLLGATGGDVVKIFYAMRETASKSAALLSVVVDRMMGILGLVIVAVLLCSTRLPLLLSQPSSQLAMTSLFFIIGGFAAVILAGFVVDRLDLAPRLPQWLPLRAKIVEFSTAFSTYARNPIVLLKAVGISIPSHLLIFLSFYFVARALGVFSGPGGLMDILSTLPAIMTVAALPISFSGIGVREGFFQKVFEQLYGIPESYGALVSITGFLITVLWGLVGGAIYLAYRPTGGLQLSAMQKEVDAVEKKVEEA